MALPQRKNREVIFQILYGFTLYDRWDEQMIPFVMKKVKITKKNALQAYEEAKEIFLSKDQLDPLIEKACKDYDFSRIATVEKTALRLAIYEMLIEKETPPKVCITEAMRLTKKFSTAESVKFVNAILDTIYQEYAS